MTKSQFISIMVCFIIIATHLIIINQNVTRSINHNERLHNLIIDSVLIHDIIERNQFDYLYEPSRVTIQCNE